MARFSLTQLLMGVALVAILLAFFQTDGCGRRLTLVECVSFSPDGSHLVVSRLDARDAQTPMPDMANVSRTLSVMDAADGSKVRLLQEDMRFGNQGTALRLWCRGRRSVAWLSDDAIVAHGFGGGPLTIYSMSGDRLPRTVNSVDYPVLNIAVSNDGSLIAASGMGDVGIVKVDTDAIVQACQTDDDPHLNASLLSFSADNARLAIVGRLLAYLYPVDPAKKGVPSVPTFFPVGSDDAMVEALTFLRDGSLLVASYEALRQYDASGMVIRTFSDKGPYYACSASQDGRIAAATHGQVEIYDVPSGKRLQTFKFNFAACLAFAPGTTNLVVGDQNGTLALVDTDSGRLVWTADAPGRYRPPWTVPIGALLVWCYVAYRLSRRRTSTRDAAAI